MRDRGRERSGRRNQDGTSTAVGREGGRETLRDIAIHLNRKVCCKLLMLHIKRRRVRVLEDNRAFILPRAAVHVFSLLPGTRYVLKGGVLRPERYSYLALVFEPTNARRYKVSRERRDMMLTLELLGNQLTTDPVHTAAHPRNGHTAMHAWLIAKGIEQPTHGMPSLAPSLAPPCGSPLPGSPRRWYLPRKTWSPAAVVPCCVVI